MSAPEPGTSIAITTVPNLRDLGGWTADGGTVRHGLIFRSAQFTDLESTDAEDFGRLGIERVYDFRTEEERIAQPNVVPDGVEYVAIDILAGRPGAGPAQILNVLGDPAAAEELLGDGQAAGYFEDAYHQIVKLPSALTGYREFYADLLREGSGPSLFHCTTGKDRTGWGAAALLLLLGVSEEDVFTEYMLTNEQLLPALQPMLDHFVSLGGDPDLLIPVLGVERSYLEGALTEMRDDFGTIEGYFMEGLGFSQGDIDRLRELFIEQS